MQYWNREQADTEDYDPLHSGPISTADDVLKNLK